MLIYTHLYNILYLPISTGVPQESVYGLLVLLIYVNDLPLMSKTLNMLKYADCTLLYCNIV